MRPFAYPARRRRAGRVRAAAAARQERAPPAPRRSSSPAAHSMLDLMKLGIDAARALVDINGLGQTLGRIEAGPDGPAPWRAGAHERGGLAPGRAARLPRHRADHALAASAQIRNMASLAGNVLQRTRCAVLPRPGWSTATSARPAPAARRWTASTASMPCSASTTTASPPTPATSRRRWWRSAPASTSPARGQPRPFPSTPCTAARTSRNGNGAGARRADHAFRRARRPLDPALALREGAGPPELRLRRSPPPPSRSTCGRHRPRGADRPRRRRLQALARARGRGPSERQAPRRGHAPRQRPTPPSPTPDRGRERLQVEPWAPHPRARAAARRRWRSRDGPKHSVPGTTPLRPSAPRRPGSTVAPR